MHHAYKNIIGAIINMENELLSLIPEYIPLGLGVYDKDGYLKYANGTTLKMFGVTMKDIYNINIFDDPNITAEDKVLLKQGLNVSFETDYDFDLCENFYETPIKGIKKYFVTKVTIMRDPEGNRQGYLLACEDITVKKAQEREIIESYKKIKATQKELSLALNAGKLSSWNYNIKEGLFCKFDVHIENIEKRSLQSIYESIHPDDRNKFMALLEAVAHKQKLPENRIILRVLENNATDYSYSSFTYSAVEDEAGNVLSEDVYTYNEEQRSYYALNVAVTADNYQEFTDSTKVYEPVSKQLDEKEHAKKKVWLNIYNASDNFLSSTYQPLLKNYDDLLNLDVEYIGGDGQTESNITNRLGNPSQYDAFAINMVKTDNAASYTSLLQ